MDGSLFFLNWRRLWLWVVIPLLLRLVITFSVTYFSRPDLEELGRSKMYASVIERMEKSEKKQAEMISPFEVKGSIPFREHFLTETSLNSKKANVRVDTQCSSEDIKGGSLQRARFVVQGTGASLHDMTLFLDYMMLEPETVLTGLDVENGSGKSEDAAVVFEVVFERVDVKPTSAKVSS